jgi:hypothetical protein
LPIGRKVVFLCILRSCRRERRECGLERGNVI